MWDAVEHTCHKTNIKKNTFTEVPTPHLKCATAHYNTLPLKRTVRIFLYNPNSIKLMLASLQLLKAKNLQRKIRKNGC